MQFILKMISNTETRVGEKCSKLPFHFGTSYVDQIITSLAFLDKTMFIKILLSESSMVLIITPSRFGKATNTRCPFYELNHGDLGYLKRYEVSVIRAKLPISELCKMPFEVLKNFDYFRKYPGKYEISKKSFYLFLHSFEEIIENGWHIFIVTFSP